MRVNEINGDWKFKVDRYYEFRDFLRRKKYKACDLAKATGFSEVSVTAKLNGNGNPCFTEKHVQSIAKFLSMTTEEVHRFFVSLHKETFKPEWENRNEASKPKTQAGCFKSGNGFEFRYIENGEIHSTYGSTEMEARKKAEIKQKERVMPKVDEANKGKAELKISKDEAMVLIDQLFHDVVSEHVKPECKSTIQSIYWRLTTQFMV